MFPEPVRLIFTLTVEPCGIRVPPADFTMQPPDDPPAQPKLRVAALLIVSTVGAGLILSILLLGRSSMPGEPGDDRSADHGVQAVEMAVANVRGAEAIGADAGVVKETERPVAQLHEEMYFLRFNYAADKISMQRGQRVVGVVKRQRSLRGKTGIYYRSLSEGGITLADGVLPDPRVVHYSLPEGEPGTATILHSGTIDLEETEFVVRVPALAGTSAIELFTVAPEDAAESRFAIAENRLGTFSLPLAATTTKHER